MIVHLYDIQGVFAGEHEIPQPVPPAVLRANDRWYNRDREQEDTRTITTPDGTKVDSPVVRYLEER